MDDENIAMDLVHSDEDVSAHQCNAESESKIEERDAIHPVSEQRNTSKCSMNAHQHLYEVYHEIVPTPDLQSDNLPTLQSSSDQLPPEVLSLIFLYCSERKPIKIPPLCHTMPWVLTHVCSRWRQIALADPRLWSSVEIHYTGLSTAVDESALLLVTNEILSRSDRGLISLAVGGGGHQILLKVVHSNLHRLWGLSLTLPYPILEPFLTSAPGSVESLRSVTLRLGGYTGLSGFIPKPITVFETASNLHTVDISETRLHGHAFNTRLLLFPWAQLTDLRLGGITLLLEAAHGLLLQCTKLVNCTLALRKSTGITAGARRLRLPYLKSIDIDLHMRAPGAMLLYALTLPSLKSFALRLHSFDTWPQEEFLSLIERSGCSLEEFSTELHTSLELEVLLRAMPNLRRLSIPGPLSISAQIMRKMAHGKLVPLLESIACTVESVGAFLNMLEARWSSHYPTGNTPYTGINEAEVVKEHLNDKGSDFRVESLRDKFRENGRRIHIDLEPHSRDYVFSSRYSSDC